MKIKQMISAGDGWRAIHYDREDDEVYEVPIIGWALVEWDERDRETYPDMVRAMIHPVGMYDVAGGQDERDFTFTDQDRTFMELAPPAGAFEFGGDDETSEELIERVRRCARKRDLAAAAAVEPVAAER